MFTTSSVDVEESSKIGLHVGANLALFFQTWKDMWIFCLFRLKSKFAVKAISSSSSSETGKVSRKGRTVDDVWRI